MRNVYFYGDEPLTIYIRREYPKVNYAHLVDYIRKRQKKNPKLTTEELTDEYTSSDRKISRTRMYNKNSLLKLCKNNGYNYTAVMQIIHRISIDPEYSHLKDYEITDLAVKEYIKNNEEQIRLTQTSNIFNELFNTDSNNIISIYNICNKLGLTISNVSDVVKMGLSFERAICVLWFFSDGVDYNGNKTISPKKVKELISKAKMLHVNFTGVTLYEAYAIFKSGLGDSLDIFNSLLISHIETLISYSFEIYSISIEDDSFNRFRTKVIRKITSGFASIYINNEKDLEMYINKQVSIILLNQIEGDSKRLPVDCKGIDNSIKRHLKSEKNKK